MSKSIKTLVVFSIALLGIILIADFYLRKSAQNKTDRAKPKASHETAAAPSSVDGSGSGHSSGHSSGHTSGHTSGAASNGRRPARDISEPEQKSEIEGDAALSALQAMSTQPWHVRRDSNSKRVKTLSGGRLALSGSTPEEQADTFVKSHLGAILIANEVELEGARVSETDRVKVSYDARVAGQRIYGATLSLIFDQGHLVRVQNDVPTLSESNLESLATKQAVRTPDQLLGVYRTLIAPDGRVGVELVPGTYPEYVLYAANSGLTRALKIIVDETSLSVRISKRFMLVLDAETGRPMLKRSTEIN